MPQVTALSPQEAESCPIRQVLSRVTGKWQVLIILALEHGALRFGVLKRTIGDVTQRVLTQNLRGLERDGYLTRTVDAGPPIAVHYALTPRGQQLLALLKQMCSWAAEVHPGVIASRAAFDQD